jgi:hypothetical protein
VTNPIAFGHTWSKIDHGKLQHFSLYRVVYSNVLSDTWMTDFETLPSNNATRVEFSGTEGSGGKRPWTLAVVAVADHCRMAIL